ncbi:MAG: class I SAM-dependent methyltransferase [Candidatus Nanoarchaeia archaeon]|nr:class I SAM-dependent methyltransferase [Candidatus Nanoarchaeia archaeon]
MNFLRLKQVFDTIDEEYKTTGKYVFKTSKGIFGVSDLEILNKFFKKINLNENFLDLGSGDGRVVFLASLFCNATGVEFEKDLVDLSEKYKKELNFNCEFICDNFENLDFSKYNILFSYSDSFFSDKFVEKLKKEFKGTLYVYQGVFLPNLKKGKTIWIEQIPIISYELA